MVTKKGTTHYRREAAQVLGWFCLTLGVLAVVSFNPTDATLFHFSSAHGAITNWCGIVGAQFAGLLFYLFGSASYGLLLATALPIYRVVMGQKMRIARIVLRVICLVATVAAIGGLYRFDLHTLPAGGLVGGFMARWLRVVWWYGQLAVRLECGMDASGQSF